jgi:excisionase family DNA binding protein
MNEWMTSDEAAAYLRVSRRTLLAWTRAGDVRGFPLHGCKRHVWRFRQSDLDAFVMMDSPSVPETERIQ